MSTGGTSSTLHIDSDENLLTVIQGKKDVVLISPKYSRDVYADEARVLGVSDVNVSAVDLERFPRVANIRYMTAHLEVRCKRCAPACVYGVSTGHIRIMAMWFLGGEAESP